jgi:methionine aminopeptidase
MIKIKTTEDVRKMQKAGSIVADVLCKIDEYIKPGLSTWDLDQRLKN